MATFKKFMIDAAGNQVPSRLIPQFDKDCDAVAKRINKRYRQQRALLEKLAIESLEEIDALSAKYINAGRGLSSKGNFSFQSFDGSIRISQRNSNRIAFDARIENARQLIFEFIHEKTGGVDADLMELVNNAFSSRSDGMLSSCRIIGLMRLKINSQKWKMAMDIIRSAVKVSGSRPIVRVEERTANGKFEQLKIDLSDCFGQSIEEFEE